MGEELTLLTAMTRLVACAALAAVWDDMVSGEGDQRSIEWWWRGEFEEEVNLRLFGG